MADIEIIASVYTGRNRPGDFSYMVDEMLKANRFDSLFIFNDNVEDHMTCQAGGGNATVRIYNRYNEFGIIPLSAGIPTGRKGKGGFKDLDEDAMDEIKLAIYEIKKLIKDYGYKKLYFSVGDDGLIGSGIFQISDSVRQYITRKIYSLSIHTVAKAEYLSSYRPKITPENSKYSSDHSFKAHGHPQSHVNDWSKDSKESFRSGSHKLQDSRSDMRYDSNSQRHHYSERPRSNSRGTKEDNFVPYNKDKHYYCASGIFLYRKKGDEVEALLGKDCGWTILGGKRDDDYHPHITATREFYEETGGILTTNERSILSKVLFQLRNDDVQSFYISKAKYCLYMVNIVAIPDSELQRTLNNIVTKFSRRSWLSLKTFQYKFNEMSALRWINFQELISPMVTSKYHEFAQLLLKKKEFLEWMKQTSLRLTSKNLVYSPTPFIPSEHRTQQHHHQQQQQQQHAMVTASNPKLHMAFDNKDYQLAEFSTAPQYMEYEFGDKSFHSNYAQVNQAVSNKENEKYYHDLQFEMAQRLKVGLLLCRYNASSDSIEFLIQMDHEGAYKFLVEEDSQTKSLLVEEDRVVNILVHGVRNRFTQHSCKSVMHFLTGQRKEDRLYIDDTIYFPIFTKELDVVTRNEIDTECKDSIGLKWITIPLSGRNLSTEFVFNGIVSIIQNDTFQYWYIDILNESSSFVFSTLQNNAKILQHEVEKEFQDLVQWVKSNSTPLKEIPPFRRGVEAVNDIIILNPSDAEYKSAERRATADGSIGKMYCIKKVICETRRLRFEAYVHSLKDRQIKQAFHGTPQVDWALNIARRGPDISKAGSVSGKSFGCGFYTALSASISEPYTRGTGSLCLLKIAPGKTFPNGHEGVTAETLTRDGYDSVYHDGNKYHILFHPDSILVEYIIDHTPNTSGLSAKDHLAYQAYEKRIRDRNTKEQIRSNTLLTYQSQSNMCEYMLKLCKQILSYRSLEDVPHIHFLSKNFNLNRQQYESKLPIFEKKEELIKIVKENQLMILQGDPGIGKTLLLPQWLNDDVLQSENSGKRVAVLVPRKMIAEGLYSRLSRLRNIPNEIGIGTGEETKIFPETKIAFFTYGYFKHLAYHDKNLSSWGAIILDEAHERDKDAVALLVHLARLCVHRPDLKVVMMSATIDSREFVRNFTDNMTKLGRSVPCPVMIVNGRNYPVDDEWYPEDGSSWNPTSVYAVRDTCIETLCIFNKETEFITDEGNGGNVLVFLPSIQLVLECTNLMQHMLTHDKKTHVYPLYATVDDEIRSEIEKFTQLYQGNGDRFICFSTNVAEAGITIPGVTAVIDSGREIFVQWDENTKADVRTVGWISKASRTQRRGRAGRTAPGRFYSMYKKSDYEAMPDYSIPPIKRSNIESFYLGLLANGINPHDQSILDNPVEELQKAKTSLLQIGAISEENSLLKVTSLGRAISQLPLDLQMANAVVYSVKVGCTDSMTIIASVSYACDVARSNIFIGSREDFIKESRRLFTWESGDHELYLNVYTQWINHDRSNHWCHAYNINSTILITAEKHYGKIQRVLQQCGISSIDDPSLDAKQLNDRILQSICYGFADNICVATNPNNLSEGLRLVKGYNTNPIIGQMHTSSIIDRKQSDQNIQYIICRNHVIVTNGSHIFFGISILNEDLVLNAAKTTLSDDEIETFRANIRSMRMINDTVILPKERRLNKREYFAFVANLKDIRNENPLYTIKVIGDYSSNKGRVHINLSCPNETVTRSIKRKIESVCLANALEESYTIENVTSIETYVQKQNELSLRMQTIRDTIRKSFGDDDSIQITGDRAKRTLTLSALSVIAYAAYKELCQYLDIRVTIPNPSRPDIVPKDYSRGSRYDLLQDRNLSMDKLKRVLNKEISGTLFAIAHFIIWNTDCWIYGGFIRDFLELGISHNEMDLDVGVPQGSSLQSEYDKLIQWAQTQNIQFIKRIDKGPDLIAVELTCFDANFACSVEFVNTERFLQKDGKVDFDVNNLKIERKGNRIVKGKKFQDQGGNVDEICYNISRMHLFVLKPNNEISARIAKMRDRGWTINYPKVAS